MEAHFIDIVGPLDDPWRLPLACLSSWAYRGIAACARADGRMEFASWESWEVAVVGLQGEGGTGRFVIVIVIVIVMPYRRRGKDGGAVHWRWWMVGVERIIN